MKRKLSALLAIVLVVVMVFPTAVFVGADDAVISATYKGVDGQSNPVTSAGISIPKGATYAINVAVASGYTATYTKNNDNGAVKFSGDNGTFSVTGSIVGETASIDVEAKKDSDIQNMTINITCVAIDVDETKVNVANVTGGEGTYTGGIFMCDTGTEITGATLSATLNNGQPATFKDVKFGLSASEAKDKVKVTTENNGAILYIFYNVEEAPGSYTPLQVRLIVSGTVVSNVVANSVSNKQHNAESLTVGEFKENYVVVKADVNGATGTFDDATITVENGTTTLDDSATINNSNIANLTFTVSYQGVDGATTCKVSDFVELNLVVPVSVRVDLSGLTKKTYVAGEKITSTKGIAVTAYDKDEQKISATSISVGTITFDAFEYGKDTVGGTVVVNGKTYNFTADLKTAGITVEQRKITKIEKDSSSTMKTSYKSGETLDMTGLKIKVTYNYGDPKVIDYSNFDFTCSPKNGATLNESDTSVLIVYTDPDTKQDYKCEIALTIEKADTKTSIKEVKLLSSSSAKKDYFIGEAFDPEGFEVLIVYSDASTKVVDLKDYKSSVTVNSSKYDTTKKQFTAAMDGDLPIKFSITHNSQKYEINLTLTGIKVTKRPLLTSIVATTSKTSFMEGDTPRVCDFTITAKYDNNTQRVFTVDAETTGATKSTYTVTKDSVYYTVKLTPTSIDSDTKSIRVTYSEKTSEYGTKTFYDDIEIEVTVPDAILTYYDNTTGVKAYVSKAYEDFYEALKDAEKIADEYGSTYTSSYYSRVPEIQLRRDVTMSYDFDTTEDMKIDLNGHNLTMIRGELSVSTKAPTDTEVVFTNTNKTDAKLIYSTDDDDTIILGEDDTFTIDKSSRSDIGKYDVTISSVKNGKVEGPREVTHGHDAKFTVTPDENYKIKSISVKEDKATKKYTETDGVVTVEDVQGDLTITVTFEEKAWDNPFTDVYKSATYYKSIQFVYENGLFSGMSATKFEPDTTMTRAMFVTVLGRLADVDTSKYTKAPDFTDVSTTDASISYAIPYIQWAVENGLIEGYGNGKFGPKDNITHIQMYVLMQRYASYIEKKNTSATTTSIPANDVADIPTWTGAYEAVQYAAKYDFLITSSNRITPNGDAKRSELAMLLEKFCDKVLEWNK